MGRTVADAIGAYHYAKRLKNGTEARCKVEVFPLEVKSQRKRWREKGERKARWFELPKAVKRFRRRACGGYCATFDGLVPIRKRANRRPLLAG